MSQFTTLDWVLWAVGWGGLLVILIPILVTAAGFRKLWHSVDENPPAVQPDGTDPEYDERFGELSALGFRPVGVVLEQTLLYQDTWYHCSLPVRLLGTKDGKTFAALYRLRPGGALRVVFDTFVTGPRLMRTAMPGVGLGGVEPEFRRVEVPWQPLADVLDGHRAEVAEFAAEHGGAVVAVSPADRSAFEVRIETAQIRAIGNGFVWFYPVLGWVLPFTQVFVGLYWLADCPAHRAAGWAAVAAGLAYRVFAWTVMPALHNLDEHCEAAGGGEPE